METHTAAKGQWPHDVQAEGPGSNLWHKLSLLLPDERLPCATQVSPIPLEASCQFRSSHLTPQLLWHLWLQERRAGSQSDPQPVAEGLALSLTNSKVKPVSESTEV